jgi:predicted SAM-dependent methyltransferase
MQKTDIPESTKDAIRIRAGEYSQRGDYHIHLDAKWPYLPVYLEKLRYVREYLEREGKEAKIVDLGCGEGVVVNEHRQKGFDIVGMDLDYTADYILNGNLLETGFEDGSYDIVMVLDVIEHLQYEDQKAAFKEIHRILKPGGKFLFTIPNLAHFASRISFLFTGKLLHTSTLDRHKGDRPVNEYLEMMAPYFKITKKAGMFPTLPLISILTYLIPSKVIGWHRLYNKLIGIPSISFLCVYECEKK